MTTKIGASYGRTSQDEDIAFSVSSQLKANREYASQHDICIPPEYEFAEDFTGKVIDRPALNKLRKLIRRRAIQVLIIYATDRLARKVGVADFLLDELFEYGIELHIVTWGTMVRDTPEDRMRFNFESTFSDFERRKIIERTTRGMREKVDRGQLMGKGTDKYGFRKVGKKREMHLEIVPHEAEILQWCFAWLIEERIGVTDMARKLTAIGVPTPAQARGRHYGRKTAEWIPATIYQFLRDESYTGVFYAYQWYSWKDSKAKGLPRKRPKDERTKLVFPELAIIDRETFDKAQKILDAGWSIHAPIPKHQYLLARRLRCQCKYSIGSSTRVKNGHYFYSYYVCPGRPGKRHNKDCQMPILRTDYVDTEVWQRLDRFLRDPEEQLATLKKAQADMTEHYAEAITYIQSIEQTRERHEHDLAFYAELLKEELITKEVMRKKKEEIDRSLRAAEEVYEEYAEKLKNKVLTDGDIDSIMADLATLRAELERLGELTFIKKRWLMEAMNITGKMNIEGGEQVLYLYAYSTQIAKILLREDLGTVPCS